MFTGIAATFLWGVPTPILSFMVLGVENHDVCIFNTYVWFACFKDIKIERKEEKIERKEEEKQAGRCRAM